MQAGSNILFAPGWYNTDIHRGVARFAGEKKWHLNAELVFNHTIPRHWQGHGILSLLSEKGPALNTLRKMKLPWVDMSLVSPELQIPRVVTDNYLIGETAAEYFLKKGFKNFAFYSPSSNWVDVERLNAFRQCLEANGEELTGIIRRPSDKERGDWRSIREVLIEQILQLPRPLAVFSGHDRLAIEIIDACICFQVEIPNEVAVLGVNNTELICNSPLIPLSSIDNNHERIGYAAAEQLSRMLDGKFPDKPHIIRIPPAGIIERQSTDALGVAHKQLQQAVAFISNNYRRPISVADVAENVSMSQRGLNNAFKKFLKDTPGNMLRRKRLQYSAKLLRETELTLEVIARVCGYSSGSNFTAAYRQLFGHSPSKERKPAK